jgi:hypothetical protein
VLAETANYLIWTADEPDGETTYNIELGSVTVHFFKEEWDEFLKLIRAVRGEGGGRSDGGSRG